MVYYIYISNSGRLEFTPHGLAVHYSNRELYSMNPVLITIRSTMWNRVNPAELHLWNRKPCPEEPHSRSVTSGSAPVGSLRQPQFLSWTMQNHSSRQNHDQDQNRSSVFSQYVEEIVCINFGELSACISVTRIHLPYI